MATKVALLIDNIPEEVKNKSGKHKLVFEISKDTNDEELKQHFKGMFYRKKSPKFDIRTKKGKKFMTIITESLEGFSSEEVSFFYKVVNAYFPIKKCETF